MGVGRVEVLPVRGLPDLRPGDDLAGLLAAAAPWLADGDVLVVTSKAVSKVEGRLVPAPAEWRWMQAGRSSPWFRGFSIYRQSLRGDWSPALSRLKHDLEMNYGAGRHSNTA